MQSWWGSIRNAILLLYPFNMPKLHSRKVVTPPIPDNFAAMGCGSTILSANAA